MAAVQSSLTTALYCTYVEHSPFRFRFPSHAITPAPGTRLGPSTTWCQPHYPPLPDCSPASTPTSTEWFTRDISHHVLRSPSHSPLSHLPPLERLDMVPSAQCTAGDQPPPSSNADESLPCTPSLLRRWRRSTHVRSRPRRSWVRYLATWRGDDMPRSAGADGSHRS